MAVWLALAVATGAVLTALTVTLAVPDMVWLVGEVASVTMTVNVCPPTGKAETLAVLLAGLWVMVLI